MYKIYQYFCSICCLLIFLTGCGNRAEMVGAQLYEPTSMSASQQEESTALEEETVAFDGAEDSSSAEMSSLENTEAIPDGKININTATCAELMSLNGIGKVRAEAVIAYRDTYGAFQEPEDIMKVYGIGEGIYRRIKEQITVQ
ncbi:MAG: ComEA family DNA-binding protein [Lachnospiraceae bacterium]|nr:ComEA family DNA-binding protein [Lachnospiraceae bacterium]